jgi:urease accessory protein
MITPFELPEETIGRGWRARLELGFALAEDRTRLVHRRHEGPLLVQKVLFPESGAPCHVCIVHPPGGVASGDDLQLEVRVAPAAHVVMTTPAAGKFYRRGPAGLARVKQTFEVESGSLEWLPQENLFYPDAAADLRTVVNLSTGSRFIGWEIACLGLPASGRSLSRGVLRLGFEAFVDGRPVVLERLALDQDVATARWGMAGFAVTGTLLVHPAQCLHLTAANELLERCGDATVACTLVDGMLVCRALAQRADRMRQLFVRLWSVLRPLVLEREAVIPRIWST